MILEYLSKILDAPVGVRIHFKCPRYVGKPGLRGQSTEYKMSCSLIFDLDLFPIKEGRSRIIIIY